MAERSRSSWYPWTRSPGREELVPTERTVVMASVTRGHRTGAETPQCLPSTS